MIIKLYKNCILTDAYSEVFDVYHKDANNKTALDRYLSTLEQKTITTLHTYVTNSGKISFDLNDEDGTEFYDFNYMSITDEVNNFTRFCFIDAVTVVNGIAVVSYIEDVWSNYAPSLQMRKSLLTRSRIIDYGSYKIPFYSLGMEYQGNNELKINSMFGYSSKVNLIFQLQLYNLTEQGKVNNRDIYEVAYCTNNGNIAELTIADAMSKAKDFMIYSSDAKITTLGKEYNFEAFNFLMIPTTFEISFALYDDFKEGDIVIARKIANFGNSKDIVKGKTFTLSSNFKQFAIGTLSNTFDVIQNGTVVDGCVASYCDDMNCFLYLIFQNQIYDITKDFQIDIPVSVQTADVTQQQATARELSQLNAKLGIASGAMQIGSAVNDIAMGASKVAFGGFTGQVGSVVKGAEQISNAPFEAGRGIINIISSKKHLDIANRALYVSNKGTAINTSVSLNAYHGIVIFEIQPDNEVEVQANIDNCGYVCNEIVDNLFNTITTGTTNKWNVMQFDYVNIYGKFTQRIADVLRDILNAGFKIWYDETAINE